MGLMWAGDLECGPNTLADGGVPPCSSQQLTLARETFSQIAQASTGVCFCGSLIRLSDITDGTSLTYLLGEKTLDPVYYLDGEDGSDDQGALDGDDDDIVRWTASLGPNPSYYLPPYQDIPGYAGIPGTTDDGFGSAHAVGFNMAFCDGSVRVINYSIDPETHRRLGNRKDGLVIDAKKW
jgi:prepilin-type processing-associated H-X9-DG protein